MPKLTLKSDSFFILSIVLLLWNFNTISFLKAYYVWLRLVITITLAKNLKKAKGRQRSERKEGGRKGRKKGRKEKNKFTCLSFQVSLWSLWNVLFMTLLFLRPIRLS